MADETRSVELLLDRLLATGHYSTISARHRATACTFICAVIDTTRQKKDAALEEAVQRTDAWRRLFVIFMERSDVSPTKSMRQVLNTVTLYLKAKLQDLEEISKARDQTVNLLLQILFDDRDHVKAKPALQAINHFLAKELIDLQALMMLYGHTGKLLRAQQNPFQQPDQHEAQVLLKSFFHGIFAWVEFNDVAFAAGQLVSQLATILLKQRTTRDATSSNTPEWALPLIESVQNKPESLSNFQNLVFPDLFRASVSDYFSFLELLNLHSRLVIDQDLSVAKTDTAEIDDEILFSALQVGKVVGLVRESGIYEDMSEPDHD